jgi:hypothetical protein
VERLTPVAQTLEMAKSELAREKVIRGKKRKPSFNQLDHISNESLGREPRRRMVGIHAFARQHGHPEQTMDRVPRAQPNQ